MCLLRKSLYGLRRAGRNWHLKLNSVLRKLGATPTKSDPCLFQIDSGEFHGSWVGNQRSWPRKSLLGRGIYANRWSSYDVPTRVRSRDSSKIRNVRLQKCHHPYWRWSQMRSQMRRTTNEEPSPDQRLPYRELIRSTYPRQRASKLHSPLAALANSITLTAPNIGKPRKECFATKGHNRCGPCLSCRNRTDPRVCQCWLGRMCRGPKIIFGLSISTQWLSHFMGYEKAANSRFVYDGGWIYGGLWMR